MSTYEIRSQKILGSLDPQDGVWSIPFEYDPEDSNLISTRGRLYVVVDLEASPTVDMHLASKIIIDEVKEKYYGDLEGTPLQVLENALISGKNKLLEITNANRESVSSLKFDLVACVVWGRVLYVAQVGNTSCIIIRGGEIVDVSNKTSGEVMTSSGLLESEDVIILGTKAFDQSFNNQDLITNLGSLDSLFKNSPNASSLSAVIVRFRKSVIPSAKDITNFISSFGNKQGKVVKKKSLEMSSEPSIPVETIQPVEESSSVTSKQPITEIKPKRGEIGKIGDTSEKRGRKPKKLIYGGLLLLLFGAVAFALYNYYPELKDFAVRSPHVSTVDIEDYKDRLNNLNDTSSEDDYSRLKSDLEKSLTLDMSNKDLIALLDQLNEKIKNRAEVNLEKESKYLFLDISDKSEGAQISKIVLAGEELLVSDTASGKAYLITKDKEIKDVDTGEGFLFANYYDGNYYILKKDSVLMGDTIDSLQEYTLDTALQDVSDFEVYFGNLYVLSGSNIYKYSLSGNSYTQSNWATLGKGDYKSLTIDGSVYISDGGNLEKYYIGEKQEYSIKNLPQELEGPVFVRTSIDEDILYILDKFHLYNIEKETGEFKDVKDISDIEETPTAFVLDGETIYIASESRIFRVE